MRDKAGVPQTHMAHMPQVLSNNAPPLKKVVPDPLYTQALIKTHKNLGKEKIRREKAS